MHLFARAAITKYHRLGGLKNRHLFSHSSAEDLEDQDQVLAEMVSSEAHEGGVCSRPFSLARRWLPSCCLVTWWSLCADMSPSLPGVSLYAHIFLLMRILVMLD